MRDETQDEERETRGEQKENWLHRVNGGGE